VTRRFGLNQMKALADLSIDEQRRQFATLETRYGE
jgi:hypothetical protein